MLGAEEKRQFFTLQSGDLASLGVKAAEITGLKPNTEAEIKKSLLPDAMTIKAVDVYKRQYQDTRELHGLYPRVWGVQLGQQKNGGRCRKGERPRDGRSAVFRADGHAAAFDRRGMETC